MPLFDVSKFLKDRGYTSAQPTPAAAPTRQETPNRQVTQFNSPAYSRPQVYNNSRYQQQAQRQVNNPYANVRRNQYWQVPDWEPYSQQYSGNAEEFIQGKVKYPDFKFYNPANQTMGQADSYWQNPQSVARWHNALKALPLGAEAPSWIDKDAVEFAYEYYNVMYEGEPYYKWSPTIREDDPMRPILLGLMAPPSAYLLGSEKVFMSESEKTDQALAGAAMDAAGFTQGAATNEFGMDPDVYDAMPGWEKALVRVMASGSAGTGAAQMGGMGAIKGFASGGVRGAIAGGLTGAAMGAGLGAIIEKEAELEARSAAGEVVVVGGGSYTDKLGKTSDVKGREYAPGTYHSPIINILNILDAGAVLPERVFGMLYQLQEAIRTGAIFKPEDKGIYDTFEDFWAFLGAAWKAGDVFYDTWAVSGENPFPSMEILGMPGFENITRSFKMIQEGLTGQPTPEDPYMMQYAPGMGAQYNMIPDQQTALNFMFDKARKMIQEGATPRDIQMMIGQETGILGQGIDLAAHIFLDLGNKAPDIQRWGTMEVIKLTNKAPDIHKAANLIGEVGHGGLVDSLKIYGSALRKFTPERLAELGTFDRMLAGVDDAGRLNLLNAPNKKPGFFKGLVQLTPQAQATETIFMLGDNTMIMLSQYDDAVTIVKTINGIAAGDPIWTGKAAELTPWINSTQGEAFTLALRDYKIDDLILEQYLATRPKMNQLQDMSKLLKVEPRELIRRIDLGEGAKVLDEYKAIKGETDLRIEDLEDIKDLVLKDYVPIEINEFKAQIFTSMEVFMDKWAAGYFKVEPDATWLRFSNLLKATQSAMVLGMNPITAVNNFMDNMTTMAWGGLVGFRTPASIDDYWKTQGITPTRLHQKFTGYDIGVGGVAGKVGELQVGAEILKAKKVPLKDKKIVDFLNSSMKSDPVQKVQFATKWMSSIEEWSGSQAMTEGYKQAFRNWQSGKWRDPLPQALRAKLGAVNPELPRFIEDMINGSNRPEEIDRIWSGIERKSIESLAPEVAAEVGIPEDTVRSFLEEFIGPETRKRLENATTDTEYRTAVDDLRLDINKRITGMVEAEVEKIASGTAEKVRLEGMQTGLQEIGEVVVDIETFWTKSSVDWGYVMEETKKLTRKEANQVIRRQDVINTMEWKRTKDIADAKVRGFIRGMGADDGMIQSLENAMMNQRQTWDVFFRDTQKMKNEYFDLMLTNKKLTAEQRSTMWQELEVKMNEMAADQYKVELDLQETIDDVYIQTFEKQFKGGGDVAQQWRTENLEVRKQMRDAQAEFRKTLVGKSAASRRKMWNKFTKDTWNPLIKKLGEVNVEGIRRFYEPFDATKSIGKSGIERRSIPEFWIRAEKSSITSPAEWKSIYKRLNQLLDPGDTPFTYLDAYRTLSLEEFKKYEKALDRLDGLRKGPEAPKAPEAPKPPEAPVKESRYGNRHEEFWGKEPPSGDDALRESKLELIKNKYQGERGRLSDAVFKGDEVAIKRANELDALKETEWEAAAKGMTDEELYHELTSFNRDNVLEGRALRTDRKDPAANELIRRHPELETEIATKNKEGLAIDADGKVIEVGYEQQASEPAQVQFMITDKMKSELSGLGYETSQIVRMTPEVAANIISSNRTRPKITLNDATAEDISAIGFNAHQHALSAVNKALGTDYKALEEVSWVEAVQVARQKLTDQPDLIDTGIGKALDHYEKVLGDLYIRRSPQLEEVQNVIHKVQAAQEINMYAGRGNMVSVDPSMVRQTFREGIAATVKKVDSKQIDGVMAIMDANAHIYGLRNGVSDGEWWTNKIRGVRDGDPELPENWKGAAEIKDGKLIIHAFESSDISTLIHEPAHLFLRDLPGEEAKIVTDWLKNTHKTEVKFDTQNGKFVDDGIAFEYDGVKYSGKAEFAEEMFVRGWEQYFREGLAPTAGLQKVFSLFSEWLRVIYKTLAGSEIDVKIDQSMRGVYDRLLAENPIERIELTKIDQGIRTQAWNDPANKYMFRMAVVELDDLVTSHKVGGDANPRYFKAMQERLRERAGSQIQIGEIAQKLDPDELLTDMHSLSRGPMIIGSDGLVESGNGRTMALMMALDLFPDKYQAYQDGLKSNIDMYGIDPKTLDNYENPVLVRVRETDVDRPKFAAEANDEIGLGVSLVEAAKKYEKALSNEYLNKFDVGEGLSTIDSLKMAGNREMVSAFMGELPKNMSKKLLDANGNVNAQGYQLMQYAIFSKAFPGDAGMRLLSQIAETNDVAMKNVENGLMKSLGSTIRLEAGIEAGKINPNMSIAEDISAAVDMHMSLKQTNQPVNMYLGNYKAFGEELSPLQIDLLRFINDHTRSSKPLDDLIRRYSEQVMKMPDEKQRGLDLGGEMSERAGKDEYVRGIITNIEKEIEETRAANAAKRTDKAIKTVGELAKTGENPEAAEAIAKINKDTEIPIQGSELAKPDSPGSPTGAANEDGTFWGQVRKIAEVWTASGKASPEEVLELIRKHYGDTEAPGLPRKLSLGKAQIEADYIMRQAEGAKDQYIADLKDVAQAVEGVKFPEGVEQFAVKGAKGGPERLVDKLMNGKKVTDSLRSTLVVESLDQVEPLLKELFLKGYETYINPFKTEETNFGRLRIAPAEDIENLYADPNPGYKHYAIKLVQGGQGDPVVKELQIMTPNMYQAKTAIGWHLYAAEREIPKFRAKYPSYADKISADEIIMGFSKEVYSEALRLDTELSAKLKSSSAITASMTIPSFVRGFPDFANASIKKLNGTLKNLEQPRFAASRISSLDANSLPVPGEPVFEGFKSLISSTIDKYSELISNPDDTIQGDLLYQRPKVSSGPAPTFFDDSAEDLSLFSNTPQKVQGEMFNPQAEDSKQLNLYSADPGLESQSKMIVVRVVGAGVNEQTVIPYGMAGEHIPQLENLMKEYPDATFSYQIKAPDGNSVYKTGKNLEDLMPKVRKGQDSLFGQRYRFDEIEPIKEDSMKYLEDYIKKDYRDLFSRGYFVREDAMENYGALLPDGSAFNAKGSGNDVLGISIQFDDFDTPDTRQKLYEFGVIQFKFDQGYKDGGTQTVFGDPFVDNKIANLTIPGIPTKDQMNSLNKWLADNETKAIHTNFVDVDGRQVGSFQGSTYMHMVGKIEDTTRTDYLLEGMFAEAKRVFDKVKNEPERGVDMYGQRIQYTPGEVEQKMQTWFDEYIDDAGQEGLDEVWFGEADSAEYFSRGFIGTEGEMFAISGAEDHRTFFGGEAVDMGMIRYYSDGGFMVIDANVDHFNYTQYKVIEDILYAKRVAGEDIDEIRFEVEGIYEVPDNGGAPGVRENRVDSRYDNIKIELDEMTEIDEVINQMKAFRDKMKAQWDNQPNYFGQSASNIRIDHITDMDAEHGGMRIIANVYKDDKLLAYLPERYDILEWQEGGKNRFRILGLDVQDARYWIIENDDGGISRMAKDGVETPNAVNAPPGTYESISPAPVSMAEITAEGYRDMVDPVLNSLSTKMQDPSNKYPNAVMGLDTKLDAQTANELKGYLQQSKVQLGEAKNTALTSAEMRRDFALHNYNKRYGFDQYLGAYAPYEFYYTRAMAKWALRILEKPTILKNYLAIRGFAANTVKGFPTRLKGKMAIPFPYMPEGAGDYLFVDPLAKANPWTQFLRPLQLLSRDENMVDKRAASIIYDMIDKEMITEEEGNKILEERKGDVWDRALAQAKTEVDTNIDNPLDMMNQIMSPNIFGNWIYQAMKGDKDKISQLPFTRLIQNTTALLGVGPEGGVNLEKPIRNALGMPEVDKYWDDRVNAQLAYMAAEGLITAEDAELAMMNKSDQNFKDATTRAGQAQGIRYPFSMFGADVYPNGELIDRNLMDDYSHMWNRMEAGESEAYDEFYDKYPEYKAWQSRFKEPEQRLKDYLVDEIWTRYRELPSLSKTEAQNLFGEKFQRSFLDRETRSYDSFTAEELAWFASQLGSTMPETSQNLPDITQDTPQMLNLPQLSEENQATMNLFYEEKDKKFPNLDKEFDVYNALPDGKQKQAIKGKTSIDAYYKFRSQFLADHPELAKYMDSNMKDVAGLPNEVQEYMAQYVEMKHTMFPNIDQIQYDYWSIENYNDQKKYRSKFPQLSRYWEFNRYAASQFPQAAPYILSNMTISKALFPNAKYGEFQEASVLQDFDPKYLSQGVNTALEEHYLMGKSISGGALAELEIVWKKMGSPGTFNKFVESLRMFY